MNDHIDPNQIAKVKEWAEDRLFGKVTSVHLNAVAEVITALPYFPVDGIEIRKALNQLSALDVPEEARKVIDGLWKLLPVPSRLTLADLIEQGYDSAQYQWMQAVHRDERCIISRINSQDPHIDVSLLTATGATIWVSTDEVIPLPDLPCLVWPASESEPAEETPEEPEVAPKVLTTVRDYEQAAKGTVVFGDAVREKSSDGLWYMPGWEPGRTSKQMRDIPRKIIYMPEVQA